MAGPEAFLPDEIEGKFPEFRVQLKSPSVHVAMAHGTMAT